MFFPGSELYSRCRADPGGCLLHPERRPQPVQSRTLGDAITVEVKSLVTPAVGPALTRIQLCLVGVLVPDDSPLLTADMVSA